MYFPEVSPLASINQLTMGLKWGDPFVIITTGSQTVADMARKTLQESGVPPESIIFDGLSHPAVNLGGEQPDALQAVIRINSNRFDSGLQDYIAASSREQLAVHLDPIEPDDSVTLLPASPLRDRSPGRDVEVDYSAELDALTSDISSALSARGYALTYTGSMSSAMNYGYDETDTDKCCLDGYLDSAEWWRGLVHYSTNDCLYRAQGAWADPEGKWEGGNVALVGDVIDVDYSVIGETGDITTFSSFFCDDEGEAHMKYSCGNETCDDEMCQVMPLSSYPAAFACNLVSGHDNLYSMFECNDDGDVEIATYLDGDCEGVKITESPLLECTNSSQHYEGEVWAGGFIRRTTVSFVIGVMTNKIGMSSFHNIYLPSFGSYNDPTVGDSLNFSEESLEGSAEFWGGEGIRSDIFAAEFSRSCVGDEGFCRPIAQQVKPDGQQFDFMSRQYVDPVSMTGPNKDEIAAHRILIFDKIQE